MGILDPPWPGRSLESCVCIPHRVDQYGFFIYWKSEGREGDVKELSQVNDIRGGELPKVGKLTDIWSSAEMIYWSVFCLSGPPAADHTQTETRGELPRAESDRL